MLVLRRAGSAIGRSSGEQGEPGHHDISGAVLSLESFVACYRLESFLCLYAVML